MNCVDRAEMSIATITEIAMTVPVKVGTTLSLFSPLSMRANKGHLTADIKLFLF